ncbi:MAG TPA: hypothetical protein VK774_05260, partial [Solirubrobacteraceae bacterium]|nr:hypothetical protein [Solirubrobacteraceae bacterium]
MSLATFRRCRRQVDRRPRERVAEPYLPAELDQTIRFCWRRGLEIKSQSFCCRTHQGQMPQGVGCRQQQQPTAARRKLLDAAPKARFDRGRDCLTIGQGERAGEVRRPPSSRQFEQCEGIASRFVDDPLDDVDVKRDMHLPGEQRTGVVLAYPVQLQGRKALQRIAGSGIAPREQHRDSLSVDPPDREREGPRGGLVEPLRIVEHTQQWTLICDIRQQARETGADHE